MGISDLGVILKQLPKSGKLLDVGCFDSEQPLWIMNALENRGYVYFGVDKSYFNSACNISKCDIEVECLSFGDCCFDIVLLNQVLEHLGRNPVFAIKEIYRVMKTGGILIVNTPNFFCLSNMKDLVTKRCQHEFFQLINDYKNDKSYCPHIRIYTRNELRLLFGYCGFVVDRVFSYKLTACLCGVFHKEK